MATVPTSSAGSMIFTQSEATAAQRTWVFHMTLAATGADFTGAAGIAMTISKAGGAFAAVDGTTAITELTNGWYKVVHAAADLDTLGCLGVRVVGTLADTLNVTHQVTLLDLNVATIAPADGGLTAAKFASDAVTALAIPPDGALTAAKFATDALAAISVPLRSVRKVVNITTNTRDKISMADAFDVTIQVTGTFGGGSAQIQTAEDLTASPIVWTNSGSALTANGSVTVTGPHNAVAVLVAGATSPVLVATYTFRKPDLS